MFLPASALLSALSVRMRGAQKDNKIFFPLSARGGPHWRRLYEYLTSREMRGKPFTASYRAGCDSSQLTAAPVTRHAWFRETSTSPSLIIHLNTLTT